VADTTNTGADVAKIPQTERKVKRVMLARGARLLRMRGVSSLAEYERLHGHGQAVHVRDSTYQHYPTWPRAIEVAR
jgi:hypothetical protein